MAGEVYTVGTETGYDRGLRQGAGRFRKIGRRGVYPGGFALASPEDAERLIDERGMRGVWAVYRLDADLERDTVPSENGWWRALVNDSVILEKVESAK
jgi:hypothetical protein